MCPSWILHKRLSVSPEVTDYMLPLNYKVLVTVTSLPKLTNNSHRNKIPQRLSQNYFTCKSSVCSMDVTQRQNKSDCSLHTLSFWPLIWDLFSKLIQYEWDCSRKRRTLTVILKISASKNLTSHDILSGSTNTDCSLASNVSDSTSGSKLRSAFSGAPLVSGKLKSQLLWSSEINKAKDILNHSRSIKHGNDLV